ncbi:protein of unknown function (DUF1540) [Halobacteroides halobius DSM 5150]|uniref:DUF1540 domain-containing protein n=1 Tax=Halobacteroides halobius (strain ATCC 35273 / DSM 5150 / MD-1) TaxID=748449 RepID=L0KED6_HALHC|nr:DUF1540 domain-containing protein [Halobacteroides halobius]AGB42423.1 protein of unknown function (DUF1540) [Halobacteroides halobius DSM 5150]
MALDNVKCTVDSCKYWKSEHCNASAIEVNVDAGVNDPNKADMTNCHTFERK